jgi:hypothetical protein
LFDPDGFAAGDVQLGGRVASGRPDPILAALTLASERDIDVRVEVRERDGAVQRYLARPGGRLVPEFPDDGYGRARAALPPNLVVAANAAEVDIREVWRHYRTVPNGSSTFADAIRAAIAATGGGSGPGAAGGGPTPGPTPGPGPGPTPGPTSGRHAGPTQPGPQAGPLPPPGPAAGGPAVTATRVPNTGADAQWRTTPDATAVLDAFRLHLTERLNGAGFLDSIVREIRQTGVVTDASGAVTAVSLAVRLWRGRELRLSVSAGDVGTLRARSTVQRRGLLNADAAVVLSNHHAGTVDLLDTLTHEIWELTSATRRAHQPSADHLLRPSARTPGRHDRLSDHDLGGVGDLQALVNRLVAAESAERPDIVVDIRAHLAHLGLVGAGAEARWELIDRSGVQSGRLPAAARGVYLELRRPGWEYGLLVEPAGQEQLAAPSTTADGLPGHGGPRNAATNLAALRTAAAAIAQNNVDGGRAGDVDAVLEEPAVEWVPPESITPTQEIDKNGAKLWRFAALMRGGKWDWNRPDARITVVRHEGRLYLAEGAHRRQAAIYAGVALLPVVDVTDEVAAAGISLRAFAVPVPPLYDVGPPPPAAGGEPVLSPSLSGAGGTDAVPPVPPAPPPPGPPDRFNAADLSRLNDLAAQYRTLPRTSWQWLRSLFDASGLAVTLGIHGADPTSGERRRDLRQHGLLTPAVAELIEILDGQQGTDPYVTAAGRWAASLHGFADEESRAHHYAKAMLEVSGELSDPFRRMTVVAGFLLDLGPGLGRFATREPRLYSRLQALAPALDALSDRDGLRAVAWRYAAAGRAERLTLRRSLAEAVALYEAIRATSAGAPILPDQVGPFLESLILPPLTAADVRTVLAAPTGERQSVDAARVADHHLTFDAGSRPVDQLTDLQVRRAQERAAVDGEFAATNLDRMPARAGQVVHLSPAQVARIASVDADLANRVRQQGVYVDLRGVIDLNPYASDAWKPAVLGPAQDGLDLRTATGRQDQWWEDVRRAEATYIEHYSTQVNAMLAANILYYVHGGRSMRPVPRALVTALEPVDGSARPEARRPAAAPVDAGPVAAAAESGSGPAATAVAPDRAESAEVESAEAESAKDTTIRLTVDQPEPAPDDRATVRYGQPLDGPAGRMPLGTATASRDDIHQGALGDCARIGVIRGVAGHRPDSIRLAVTENGNGSYVVRLYETRWFDLKALPTGKLIEITVTPALLVTEGGDFAYARSRNNAAWGPILEKAIIGLSRLWTSVQRAEWHARQRTYHAEQRDEWLRGPGKGTAVEPLPDKMTVPPTGYAEIGSGTTTQEQAELLTALTGVVATSSALKFKRAQPGQIPNAIRELLAAGSPVLVSTKAPEKYLHEQLNGAGIGPQLPYGLIHKHSYEILSIDDHGNVELSNPWGIADPTSRIPFDELVVLMNTGFVHLDLPINTPLTAITPSNSAPVVGVG